MIHISCPDLGGSGCGGIWAVSGELRTAGGGRRPLLEARLLVRGEPGAGMPKQSKASRVGRMRSLSWHCTAITKDTLDAQECDTRARSTCNMLQQRQSASASTLVPHSRARSLSRGFAGKTEQCADWSQQGLESGSFGSACSPLLVVTLCLPPTTLGCNPACKMQGLQIRGTVQCWQQARTAACTTMVGMWGGQ